MYNLTIVAVLSKCRKVVAVPLRYVYKLNLAKSLNNRINRNQEHLMFWSSDFTKEPNFNLPVSDRFDKSGDACYMVKLLKVFGKFVNTLKIRFQLSFGFDIISSFFFKQKIVRLQ